MERRGSSGIFRFFFCFANPQGARAAAESVASDAQDLDLA